MSHKGKDAALKYLADENIPASCIRKMQQLGIDLVSSLDLVPAGTIDEKILKVAYSENRILITFDKDFGEQVFRFDRASVGVILLRFSPRSVEEITKSIDNLLGLDIGLKNRFTVVEKKRIRTIPI
jgi:predicted nuclease of predicted toxin-antitoxin system